MNFVCTLITSLATLQLVSGWWLFESEQVPAEGVLEIEPYSLVMQRKRSTNFWFRSSAALSTDIDIVFKSSPYFHLIPNQTTIGHNSTAWIKAKIDAVEVVAHTFLEAESCKDRPMVSDAALRQDYDDSIPWEEGRNRTNRTCVLDVSPAYAAITIVHSIPLHTVIQVVGWIYFVAWSISFYPQMYLNWSRKSVIGLNFDFLALNILGFVCYSIFNTVLFWSTDVQRLYRINHPRGAIPVLINDVCFSLHAAFACLVTIVQCFIYERGNQRVSYICQGLLALFLIFAGGNLLLVRFTPILDMLQFITYVSYIKLAVTLIKYMPQAYFNYQRQSTSGWSIWNILLDFTGGSMSSMQMFLQAYNCNDWSSLFGDFTKFGLGFISLLFDLLFMFQHYVLYRHRPGVVSYEKFDNSDAEDDSSMVHPVRPNTLPNYGSNEEVNEDPSTSVDVTPNV